MLTCTLWGAVTCHALVMRCCAVRLAASLKVAEHLGASEDMERWAGRQRVRATGLACIAKAAREACESKAACEPVSDCGEGGHCAS